MKTILQFFVITSLLLFGLQACKTDGFTKDEIRIIQSGDVNSVMPLYTINNVSDSLLLRQVARKIEKRNIKSANLEHLRLRMLATVTDSSNVGVGLAASQVGISVRMIYVQRFDKPGEPYEIYYNPVILEYGDSINSGREGCLSVPSYRGTVDRSQNIVLSYLDSLGNKQNEKINEFTAVIFQHEVDHINGVLYYDHIFDGFNSLALIEGF